MQGAPVRCFYLMKTMISQMVCIKLAQNIYAIMALSPDLSTKEAERYHGKIKKKPKDLFENVAFLQPGVKEQDIIVFSRQFSTMIDAGLPIIQCLDILQAQQENITFKKMLKDIKESVEGGQTLAEALKKYPDWNEKRFPEVFSKHHRPSLKNTCSPVTFNVNRHTACFVAGMLK